jgi:hypothetical protein
LVGIELNPGPVPAALLGAFTAMMGKKVIRALGKKKQPQSAIKMSRTRTNENARRAIKEKFKQSRNKLRSRSNFSAGNLSLSKTSAMVQTNGILRRSGAGGIHSEPFSAYTLGVYSDHNGFLYLATTQLASGSTAPGNLCTCDIFPGTADQTPQLNLLGVRVNNLSKCFSEYRIRNLSIEYVGGQATSATGVFGLAYLMDSGQASFSLQANQWNLVSSASPSIVGPPYATNQRRRMRIPNNLDTWCYTSNTASATSSSALTQLQQRAEAWGSIMVGSPTLYTGMADTALGYIVISGILDFKGTTINNPGLGSNALVSSPPAGNSLPATNPSSGPYPSFTMETSANTSTAAAPFGTTYPTGATIATGLNVSIIDDSHVGFGYAVGPGNGIFQVMISGKNLNAVSGSFSAGVASAGTAVGTLQSTQVQATSAPYTYVFTLAVSGTDGLGTNYVSLHMVGSGITSGDVTLIITQVA